MSLLVCCSQRGVDREGDNCIPRWSETPGWVVLGPISRKVPDQWEMKRAGCCCDYFPRMTVLKMTLQDLFKMSNRILIC